MELLIKGLITGLVIVLPGMSGGTMLLLLGLYEKLIKDLSRLKLLPWLPFALGTAGGILLSGVTLAWLLEKYTAIVAAFLLGSILASVKAVLGENYRPTVSRVTLFVLGAVSGFLMANEPMGMVENAARPGMLLLLLGGALAAVAMILPGVPGSSVMIILGIYDDVFTALGSLDWLTLVLFLAGALIGIFGLSTALDKIYTRHKAPISWFFSGLVLGAGRVLLPASLDNPIPLLLAAAAGFALVWWWGDK